MCLFVSIPMFWAYATSADERIFGPLGISIVNSAGSVGGFAGPILVGWVQQHATGFGWSLTMLGSVLAVSGVLIGLALAPIRPMREVAQ
jgi:MFS family permease